MKTLREIFFFIIGLAAGFLTLICFDSNSNRIYVYELFVKNIDIPIIKLDKYGWVANLCILVSVLILGIILTYIIRLFMDSSNLEKSKSILKLCITLLVGCVVACPFTQLLAYSVTIVLTNLSQSYPIHVSGNEPDIYIISYLVFYYPMSRIMGFLFAGSYRKMLLQPKKNFRLLLCEANVTKSYDEIEVLMNKGLFKDCYNYIRNQDNQLKSKQFYRIVETNWNNTREVDHWNYYHTGELVSIPEEEFFHKLYLAEYAKDVNWFD
ncbi:MAG: hypothetical protein IJ619_12010 [Eubacterium sp.]|nr:hypothetical protein [Eubacterium sp.]